jgi:hypothetical protein
MLEMKIVLPAVLRAYELRPDQPEPEPARRRNVSVRPARGARIGLSRRSARVPVAT